MLPLPMGHPPFGPCRTFGMLGSHATKLSWSQRWACLFAVSRISLSVVDAAAADLDKFWPWSCEVAQRSSHL